MKKFLASGMFVFLSVCATMTANDIKEFCETGKETSLKIYDLYSLNYQDIEPPDLYQIYEMGYWKGVSDAYSNVINHLTDSNP